MGNSIDLAIVYRSIQCAESAVEKARVSVNPDYEKMKAIVIKEFERFQ